MKNDDFLVNAQGHRVPIELVRPIDLARDDLVRTTYSKAVAMRTILSQFKDETFGDIEAFLDLSVEQYGVKRPGGQKGNVTLLSFDGKIKIVRAMAERLNFDERLLAAKTLIDECIHDWTKDSRVEIKALIERAFATDKEGNIRTGAVLALRRVDIKDARWVKAMQAISEAVQVVSSKAYVRVYRRIGDSERFEAIALDVAGA